jgi:hypothetical protein
LKLEKLLVVTPGADRFPLVKKIEALGLERLTKEGLSG